MRTALSLGATALRQHLLNHICFTRLEVLSALEVGSVAAHSLLGRVDIHRGHPLDTVWRDHRAIFRSHDADPWTLMDEHLGQLLSLLLDLSFTSVR